MVEVLSIGPKYFVNQEFDDSNPMGDTWRMRKQHVHLSQGDREALEMLVSKGKQSARVYKRALGLLELDRGKTITAVAETVGACHTSVRAWRNNYQESGLGRLADAPRSGHPVEISGEQRAQITALACSKAPAGQGRWSLRLLADKIVELGYCEHISHSHVRTILKKTNSSPI